MLHRVVTTENVAVTYQAAGMGSRFLAWLADMLCLGMFGIGGVLAASVLDIGRQGSGTAVALLWIFFLKWGYFLVFEWLWSGQTPGKRLMGIRVIQKDGPGLTFAHSAVRNLLRVADALPFFYALGFVVAACDRLHRRLGDLAAGTVVVHMEGSARAVQALPDLPELSAEPKPWARRLATLERAQKETILDLCLRREQLAPIERTRIFHIAAEHVRTRLGVPENDHISDEWFLLTVAAQMTRRTRTRT